MREPLKWYDANATDNPPWIKALAEVRHLATREGWRYHHVQADHCRHRPVRRVSAGQSRILLE
jgi:hypothetical protein